jgi:hypothetical protein
MKQKKTKYGLAFKAVTIELKSTYACGFMEQTYHVGTDHITSSLWPMFFLPFSMVGEYERMSHVQDIDFGTDGDRFLVVAYPMSSLTKCLNTMTSRTMTRLNHSRDWAEFVMEHRNELIPSSTEDGCYYGSPFIKVLCLANPKQNAGDAMRMYKRRYARLLKGV